ncbi:MAG TPA: c-type cytochrome [Pirellulaceae bacterium]|nr:c-type cytochrome [Pirellulaceae bacterium]
MKFRLEKSDGTWRWFGSLAIFLALAQPCAAQDGDDEQPYLPGLLATYEDASARQARRLDDAIAFDWKETLPDPRLSKSAFTSRWQGLLLAQGAGEYRLHVFATGQVEVRLAGKVAIQRQRLKEAWAVSQPLTLSFDHHPLEVEFQQTEASARIALFWSGPQFALEPISPRSFWHDRKATVSSDFERGRLLAAALRCGACHQHEASEPVMPAPSLANLAGNIQPQWLIDWLMESGHETKELDAGQPLPALRRMPSLGLPRDDAEAIAAYLLPPGEKRPKPKPDSANAADERKAEQAGPSAEDENGEKQTSNKKKEAKKEPPSAKQGERLFLTLGCLSCHQWGKLGESGLFGGGDLSQVGDKRPADFFARWLADPAAINRRHRMPVFELTGDERTSLSLFLAEQRTKQRDAPARLDASAKIASRGRELALKLRCGACHELPEMPAKPAPIATVKLDDRFDWSRSCASARSESKTGLGYGLLPEQQRQLETFFRGSNQQGQIDSPPDGDMLLVTHNCLACHARDGQVAIASALPAKLADKLAAVGQAHDELAPLIPAMTPPSLNSVGDKLHDEALAAAIRRSTAPYRHYLLVRMPRFRLSDQELAALTRHFVTADRIPAGGAAVAQRPAVQEPALAAAGGRLVSTDGFSCVSCHQIGSVVPDKAPLNARGPGLSQIDQRIRREWFDRFVADPSRIVPRMEMPSVRIPVKGVLGDKVDAQLAAVWHVVNLPLFEPPEPNPVRVLRRSGIAERNEPPIAISDVVKIGERTIVHPLVIGLPNRQNFLYDLSEGRLAAWWLGDAARQRTKGKSWHWEPGGPMVMPAADGGAELSLIRGGKRLVPLRNGQHHATLSGYKLAEGGVQATYRMNFGDPERPAAPTIAVEISDHWLPGRDAASWRTESLRVLKIVPALAPDEQVSIAVQLAPGNAKWERSADGRSVRMIEAPRAEIVLHGRSEGGWTLSENGTATSVPTTAQHRGMYLVLHYRSGLTPDTLDAPEPVFPADVGPVKVAPGFTGRRLPLPAGLMPTGLAWKSAAGEPQLLIGSLKGQVIAARDSDSDGLEDAVRVVADGLATPYGIADDGDAVHVLTKAALLEVKDGGVKVLASGWGHSDDYHDWAVGLPRNQQGEYFIGLPCQQDKRSAAAAKFRGAVLKLTPRMPTGDNPQRYDLHVVSTGHRFPMGLALDRRGELFVTDNQGNYNPFNELNHVRQAAFFGFINANEKKDNGFQAPPLTEPAIDIPHPWTRSVNGICFLDTPQPLRKEGKSLFGPLEGHLVGCEYDTRRLVRMTLQQVGDTYQGAAYPLSLEPSSPEKGFLGPVVCALSPRGELYVGSMRDSGWGAGNNVGEVVQVRIAPDELPAGIGQVRAIAAGFEVDFIRQVDVAKAGDSANYSISSYRRESTPAYGGPDLDRRIEKVTGIAVSPDRRRVALKLAELREGFVYEFQLKSLTGDGGVFHPAEAHYTLRKRPD